MIMSHQSVEIPRTLVNQMLHLAQVAAEAEVCGLIAAKSGKPVRCYPIRNAADSPASRFLLDPKEQIEAMREMRQRGEELFAIFHSHPRTPAAPSPRDLAEASYPEALQLIVSLGTCGVLELRGYRIDPARGEAAEVPLLLVP
jgi:proteasome lid subunit RPN8/RPN11